MDNDILLNVESKEIRYAHLKNGQLVDLIVERKKARQLTGNIYRGKVTNILRNIQSAFIDINEGENGFIHMSDILENTKKFEQQFDMDFDLDYDIQQVNTKKKKQEKIEDLLKTDQPVLVQVVKEPIGSKGARLTSNVSIAGRYLVLLPNSPHRGVSRKIEDRGARDRLKKLIRAFEMPQEMGLICRTASVHATTDMLIDEANELFETWNSIMQKFNETSKPCLLLEESDIVKKAVITCIDKKYSRLLVDDYSTYQRCKRIYRKFSGEHLLRIEYFRDKSPMFERFNVEREIEKATRLKVWLQSGGYLFFDRTEAMYTIDVNSGRSSNSDQDVEDTLLKINLEAAAEIARQLRIRNIGGLVIVDFIDMRYRKNQRKVLDRLKECMKEDPAKGTILNMSEFGMVEMTRQRSRESLMQTIYTACPYCSGSGLIKTHESITIEIERSLKKVTRQLEQFGLRLTVHPSLYAYMRDGGEFEYLEKMAKELKARLEFAEDDTLHLNDYKFFSTVSRQPIEI
ncbi:MAG: ribonuclease E/G [Chlamydiales bacterium]|nr:ribonuclease E/G [Chlamydiales bacterium]